VAVLGCDRKGERNRFDLKAIAQLAAFGEPS
jgi:hypothetical protein